MRASGSTPCPWRRRRQLVALVLATLCLCECSRRAGLNFECKWVPDPAIRVDLRNGSDVQHLLGDIRVAEELGIRYGDRIAGYRLVEIVGIVSRHGGVKDRGLGRRSRHQCVATLIEAIASTHGVAVSDIERVRPQLAERGFALPLTIPVGLVLVLAVRGFMRWIRTRFETDEWAGWLLATVFASLIIPAVVLAIGGAWTAVVEIARLGNEHVGERARVEGLRLHALAVLGVGMAAVWIGSGITAIRKRGDESEGKVVGCDVETIKGDAQIQTLGERGSQRTDHEP